MFINYFFTDSVIVHGDWFGVDLFQFVGVTIYNTNAIRYDTIRYDTIRYNTIQVSRLVGQYEGWHLKLVKLINE